MIDVTQQKRSLGMYAGNLFIFLLTMLWNTALDAQDNDPKNTHALQECKVMRVGGPQNWQPVSYETPQGNPTGLGIDILHQYGQEKGIQIDIELEIPWARTLQMLETGQFDIVAGAYFTPERAVKYAYSIPFFHDDIMVFQHRKRTFEYKTISDLIGHRGTRVYGGSLGNQIDQYSKQNLDIVFTPTENSIFDMLLLGRVDYVLASRFGGTASLLAETPEPNMIISVEPPLARNTVSFMLSRVSPCKNHVRELNELILRLQHEGALNSWLERHLELTITRPRDNS